MLAVSYALPSAEHHRYHRPLPAVVKIFCSAPVVRVCRVTSAAPPSPQPSAGVDEPPPRLRSNSNSTVHALQTATRPPRSRAIHNRRANRRPRQAVRPPRVMIMTARTGCSPRPGTCTSAGTAPSLLEATPSGSFARPCVSDRSGRRRIRVLRWSRGSTTSSRRSPTLAISWEKIFQEAAAQTAAVAAKIAAPWEMLAPVLAVPEARR